VADKLPMVAPVNVVDADAISTGVVNTASDAFCHFTTLPVFPLNVRPDGCVPLHIVCVPAAVPPTEAGSTVIVAAFEFTVPFTFVNTALYW
jgi:hypothetical protein